MRFVTPLLLLLSTPPSSFAQQSHLRGLQSDVTLQHKEDALMRDYISDAILSAIHSEDGTVDPFILIKANREGVPSELLHQLAREANSKIHVDGIPMSQIEDEMKQLREGTLFDDEKKKKKKEKVKPNEKPQPKIPESRNRTPSANKGYTSNRAIIALSKAVLSGFRNPNGEMDEQLYFEAIEAGAEPDQIHETLATMMKKAKREYHYTKSTPEISEQKVEELDDAGVVVVNTVVLVEHKKEEEKEKEELEKPKSLSNRAMNAITRAALSGYRSASGLVDPNLMAQAIKLGASRKLVMKSVQMLKINGSNGSQLGDTLVEPATEDQQPAQQQQQQQQQQQPAQQQQQQQQQMAVSVPSKQVVVDEALPELEILPVA